MKVDVLLGLQWGDEGKGKIVDVLTPKYDVIARFQGGPNAGHSLEFNNIKHVLHIIPSGIFHAGSINIIGNGVVIDPVIFKKEIIALEALGVNPRKNLFISKKAHLILPSHRLLDAAQEQSKGKGKIGSTLKGIGPTYTDKTARCGLRIGDINNPDFTSKYNELKKIHIERIASLKVEVSIDINENEWFDGVNLLREFNFIDNEVVVNSYLENNKKVLAEGAQGTLLDIDFGTYPFVTSSNTVCAGACTGLGIAPNKIGEVLGIFKAYCTRVGSGPFPTELFDETGDKLRKQGNEFGSTTGRPRRCGWLDLPALKYSIMINGVTRLIMTKADVMNNFEIIKICTSYKHQNESIDYVPFDLSDVTPVYTEFKGWNDNIENYSAFSELPDNLKEYIKFIEKETGVPVQIVSTGPDRKQIISR